MQSCNSKQRLDTVLTVLSHLNSWRKSWKANSAARHAGFDYCRLCTNWSVLSLTKKTQKFRDAQLTDVYGSCVVELKRSWMQEATLLTTVYLCTTTIDFPQFHWIFKSTVQHPLINFRKFSLRHFMILVYLSLNHKEHWSDLSWMSLSYKV